MHGGLKLLIGTIVTAIGITAAAPAASAATTLYAVNPPNANKLITNEYAFWNPTAASAVRSADWENNSGSLFAKQTVDGPAYWTGVPDNKAPDALSRKGTNSAVFRLTTKRNDFLNMQTAFKLKVQKQTSTSSTPAVAWDGVHVFLRYQSEESLYYASIARRDGALVLKKKCRGGPSNGGTYHTLGSKSGFPIALGQWTAYGSSIRTNTDGSVAVTLSRAGKSVLTITDKGTGCAPIRTAGKTGIRGDNTDFLFQSFQVTSL
ncbi:hypothetical protein [Pilimelia columellifera]|uniref:Uncharacterized protein n=1 Tax=Pilimelia columellifera subsp. columellifera TaxID=706583 RepID=A0ABP6AXR1_9ACTN